MMRGMIVPAACALIGFSAQAGLQLGPGELAVRWNESILSGMGWQLTAEDSLPSGRAGETIQGVLPSPSFSILDDRPAEGRLLVEGRVRLSSSLLLEDTHLEPGQGDLLNWVAADGSTLFHIRFAHTHTRVSDLRYFAEQADLVLSSTLAASLQHPEWAGVSVGEVSLRATIAAFSPSNSSTGFVSGADASLGTSCTDDFGPAIDLELTGMPSISQIYRDPGNRVAFAPSAVLKNVGPSPIRWFWAIAPPGFNGTRIGPHPFLIMHAYRIKDGLIQQIGQSDVKHAWNTVNQNCGCPGGQVMYLDCSDTYGVANNANRYYFGPRSELTAHTASWDSLGSHFDATPVDNIRDHFDNPGDHHPLDHVLSVPESMLADTAVDFLIEAWYIAADDTNRYNNVGFRRFTSTLSGSFYLFGFNDAQRTPGPAIQAWLDPENPPPGSAYTLAESPSGDVHLAVKTTHLTNGLFRYDVALHNFDYDPGLVRFSLPLQEGAVVTNAVFLDTDEDPGNDWTLDVSGGALSWVAPTNRVQAWGTLHSFRFDSSAAPSMQSATLLSSEIQGLQTVLSPETLAPAGFRLEDVIPNQVLSWQSVSGATYRVETSLGFPNPQWLPASDAQFATGSTTVLPWSSLTNTGSVFRVVLPD